MSVRKGLEIAGKSPAQCRKSRYTSASRTLSTASAERLLSGPSPCIVSFVNDVELGVERRRDFTGEQLVCFR